VDCEFLFSSQSRAEPSRLCAVCRVPCAVRRVLCIVSDASVMMPKSGGLVTPQLMELLPRVVIARLKPFLVN